MNLLLLLPGAFFAPIIHEFVKARVSAALGDPTPKKNGFITWNPFKYFEPIGFILMMFFSVGWGQPVTTSPFYYKNKKAGIILTYTIPMLVNLFIGLTTLAFINIFGMLLMERVAAFSVANDVSGAFGVATNLLVSLRFFGELNIRLAIFNLIPIFPLAMNKMLHVFVSPETSMQLNHYEKIMQIVLILMLIFGVLEIFINPIARVLMWTVSFSWT
jgi:Zn-dependent protease